MRQRKQFYSEVEERQKVEIEQLKYQLREARDDIIRNRQMITAKDNIIQNSQFNQELQQKRYARLEDKIKELNQLKPPSSLEVQELNKKISQLKLQNQIYQQKQIAQTALLQTFRTKLNEQSTLLSQSHSNNELLLQMVNESQKVPE